MEKRRYFWVDNVKTLAILLVALGHMLMGLLGAGVFTEQTYPKEFVSFIYIFHVPLFFICSGFLYQRLTEKQDFKGYSKNVLKKLIALGIPYVVFVLITYLIKLIFSSSVNYMNSNGIIKQLLYAEMAPYWFLYALFILFVISPIIRNGADAVIRLLLSLALYIAFEIFSPSILPEILRVILTLIRQNLYWFVLGMLLAFYDLEKLFKKRGIALFALFCILFALTRKYGVSFYGLNLISGTLACAGIISFIGSVSDKKENNKALAFLAKYTTPIFLMHTIFAAFIRTVLIKIGITSLIIHLFAGLISSVALPIIAAMLMEKLRLDFLYNPTKYIKIK